MLKIRLIFIGIFCLIWIFSCQFDSQSFEDKIIGNWKIVEAKRNNKITTTLKDGFFRFDENGMMTTNILGDTSSYSYTIEQNVITQNSRTQIIYSIEELQSDSLFLKSQIQNYLFDFVAVRESSD